MANKVTFHDFLTGRDEEIKRIEGQLPSNPNDEKYTAICTTIIRDYQKDCKKYKTSMNGLMQMSITSSLTSFTDAVVRYTQNLKSPMDLLQAHTILKAARFLRLCVAGRTVYTQKCVAQRDIGHLYAENLFSRALIALNNKRSEAIQVASRGQKITKKKSGKNKKRGGQKSVTERAETANLFSLLTDALEDVNEPMETLHIDEAKADQGEVKTGDKEEVGPSTDTKDADLAPGAFIEAFLDQEVDSMKDTVNYILAADHMSDISHRIWEGNNDRETVHLKSYKYIGLPTKSVHDFLHTLPKNRMLFHRLGVHLREGHEYGEITAQQVVETFEVFVQFIKGIRDTKTLELVTTCATALWHPEHPDKVPKIDVLEYRLRLLSVANRVDPLVITYLSHFPRILFCLLKNARQKPKAEAIRFVSDITHGFRINFAQHPTVEHLILTGEDYGAQAFIDNSTPRNNPPKNTESNFLTYSPTFVCFHDYRVGSTMVPMRLPVEILQDNDAVSLRIYHQSVDDYVTDLIRANLANPGIGQETLQVFIPSSHMAYFPGRQNNEHIETHGKSVDVVVHVDETRQILVATAVEPQTA